MLKLKFACATTEQGWVHRSGRADVVLGGALRPSACRVAEPGVSSHPPGPAGYRSWLMRLVAAMSK